LDLIMTRVRRDHVRALYVAGRAVVADGRLTGVDLQAAETELATVARAAGPEMRSKHDLLKRHLRSVQDYYRNGGHLTNRGNRNE